MPVILVTGATGTIGSKVLDILAARGLQVRAVSRDPRNVPVRPGVETVRADFDEPASLRPAMAAVRTMFLITAPVVPTARHDLALLDEARRAGVRRVVKLSAIGTGEKIGPDTVGAWHVTAEQAVRDSGLGWTVLRPSSFASNTLQWVDAIDKGQPVPDLTGPGRQGVINPYDVAAAAVEVLLSSAHVGKIYTLTGPELLTVAEQAASLSRVTGRRIGTVPMSLEQAADQMLAAGMDRSAVEVIIIGSAWVRAGRNAILTNDLATVLGRPPTSFQAWAYQHRHAFGAS
ncbi:MULTISPECIES: NAD(P)H-binding protein [unclassified Parafrankia]|uniref:NAD(P)H-binding protein n=1 Tax=unclassified Parafrankia TaxID=2994368 RepID=UPI000DD41FAC|nr:MULTISPECIES: NAD(P)H-binding protein [unclassified Parafrankia]TCJ33372.1 NAD-dependent epimerase/dehydratase family protein [Parafrankia sp. BMG5.11]